MHKQYRYTSVQYSYIYVYYSALLAEPWNGKFSSQWQVIIGPNLINF